MPACLNLTFHFPETMESVLEAHMPACLDPDQRLLALQVVLQMVCLAPSLPVHRTLALQVVPQPVCLPRRQVMGLQQLAAHKASRPHSARCQACLLPHTIQS